MGLRFRQGLWRCGDRIECMVDWGVEVMVGDDDGVIFSFDTVFGFRQDG